MRLCYTGVSHIDLSGVLALEDMHGKSRLNRYAPSCRGVLGAVAFSPYSVMN